MCKHKRILKKGELYEDVRKTLRPFDAIFFGGDAIFSKIVKLTEKHGNYMEGMNEFSHVGIVVTSDILLHPLILPGKFYILESTWGGKFGHDVMNIEGNTCIGVQLRDLDEVVDAYDKSNQSVIAVSHVIINPLDHMTNKEVRDKFTEFFMIYNGKKYDVNVYSLLSSVFKCLRPCRPKIEQFLHTEDWYFCSEIVALAYKHLSIYPANINEKDVLPRDILYPNTDIDLLMPQIVSHPIYITTKKHYQEKNKCHNITK